MHAFIHSFHVERAYRVLGPGGPAGDEGEQSSPFHKLLSITTTFQTAVTNYVCRCGGEESGTRVF